ncbi:hypothetical protein D3C78_1687420 [compost metagenome]
MQPTIEGLPAIVAANAILRRPINFEIAERAIVKATQQRVAVAGIQLTLQVGGLGFERAAHFPEGVNAR